MPNPTMPMASKGTHADSGDAFAVAVAVDCVATGVDDAVKDVTGEAVACVDGNSVAMPATGPVPFTTVTVLLIGAPNIW